MIKNNGGQKKTAENKLDNEKQKSFQNRLQKEISTLCVFLKYDCYSTLKATQKNKRL